ncbi:MAG: peptide deformylase [bacterium]
MAVLKILTSQNPVLRKTSKPVAKVTKEIRKLAADMEETLRVAPGIGLAAPQVGELLRVIVADIGDGLYVLINPKIVKKSGTQELIEGCLSLPGIEAPVERANKVTVKAMDINGKRIQVEACDLLATVFQHEIDHLDGRLFVDRVNDPNLIGYRPKTPKEEAI